MNIILFTGFIFRKKQLHLPTMSDTESVRINKELKRQLKELAQSMRPRTAVQYLIEDAIEQYLDRVAEEGGTGYRVKEKPAGKKH